METLSRLLPFSRDVYLRLVEQYNAAIWPAQAGAYGLALLALLAAFRPFAGSDRLIAVLLAAAWIWTGVAYHMLRFATINWAAWAVGFFFVMQGLLFLSTGLIRGRLTFHLTRDPTALGGLAIIIFAMIFYPLIGAAAGQGWPRTALLGVTPSPTILFTFGLLLMADGRVPWHLLVIPLICSVTSGMAALLLDIPQDFALIVIAVLSVVLAVSKNRSIRL